MSAGPLGATPVLIGQPVSAAARRAQGRGTPRAAAHPELEGRITAGLRKLLSAEQLAAPDVKARIRDNAAALASRGIQTEAQLGQFMSQCWRHDAAMAIVGLGLSDNLGYFAGITSANESLVAKLPAHILKNPALVGLLVGLGVGVLDVVISVGGGAMAKQRLYNGQDGNAKLPPSVPDASATVPGFLTGVTRKTFLNVAKNSTRLFVPGLMTKAEQDGLVKRKPADRVDLTGLDGGLGFVSVATDAYMKLLHDGQNYDTRLLLRQDLPDVIDKSRQSMATAAADAGSAFAGGVKELVSSPVPAAVVATIGTFVSVLFAANASVDQVGTALANAARDTPIPDTMVDPATLTTKRAVSTMLFGTMTATLAVLPAAMEAVVTPALKSAAATAMAGIQVAGAALPDLSHFARELFGESEQQHRVAQNSGAAV